MTEESKFRAADQDDPQKPLPENLLEKEKANPNAKKESEDLFHWEREHKTTTKWSYLIGRILLFLSLLSVALVKSCTIHCKISSLIDDAKNPVIAAGIDWPLAAVIIAGCAMTASLFIACAIMVSPRGKTIFGTSISDLEKISKVIKDLKG